MGTSAEDQKFVAVDLATLEPGMLLDRPLFGYLTSNQRYVRLCEALRPLELRTIEKFKKLGNAFSTAPAITERYVELVASARSVRILCDDQDAAAFEKNRTIRDSTRWLVPHALKRGGDLTAPVFFFHKAFGAPSAETLQYVSDLSVVMCERSLKIATISGVLSLWLGYSDSKFLTEFVSIVFCEEVGRFNASAVAGDSDVLTDEHRNKTAQLISDGQIPGITTIDERFRLLLSQRARVVAAGDELRSIIDYARWVCGVDDEATQGVARWRVTRKIKQVLGGATVSGAPRDASKEAA